MVRLVARITTYVQDSSKARLDYQPLFREMSPRSLLLMEIEPSLVRHNDQFLLMRTFLFDVASRIIFSLIAIFFLTEKNIRKLKENE